MSLPSFALLCAAAAVGVHCTANRSALVNPLQSVYAEITRGYDKHVRPTVDQHVPTVVTIHVPLFDLIDLFFAENTIRARVVVKMSWNDPFMAWNPADHDGIVKIALSRDEIWLPPVTLARLKRLKRSSLIDNNGFCMGHHDGTVTMDLVQIVDVGCVLDPSMFPFDEHRCRVVFETGNYDADWLRLRAYEDGDMSGTAISIGNEWQILSATMTGANSTVVADNNAVALVLCLRRQPMFYVVNVILPVFLTACLTVLAIFSPSNVQLERDEDEKVAIGLTAMLSIAVFLMMSADWIPKINEPFNFPILGIFFIVELMVVFTATACAIVVTHAECAGYGDKAPLARLCCMKPAKSHEQWKIACYRLDMLLMVVFQLINFVMVLSILGYASFIKYRCAPM